MIIKPFVGEFPITQTFQQHVDQHLPNYNGGIDWGMPVGTEMVACMDAAITVAQEGSTGYGTHVKMLSGRYLAVYGHFSRLACKVGDQVKAGQLIGYSGNTGNSTGPHLHFEIRQDGIPVDPMPLLVPPKPLWFGKVLETMNLRNNPGLKGVRVGSAYPGMVLAVWATREADGYWWAKVSNSLWVATSFGGYNYVEKYFI